MAEVPRSKSSGTTGSRRQSSRLQKRAPSSLQVNRSVNWNVAIPLLSPLTTSPVEGRIPLAAPSEESQIVQQQPEKVVFNKWQHPAAPFGYEPAPLRRPFVPA